MIVTPDLYFNSQKMNIGVQYDPRQPAFPNMDHHPWMVSANPPTPPTPPGSAVIKEEPREDVEYGQSTRDSVLPMTPPPYQSYPQTNAYRDATPPKDTPPASSPSPQGNKEGSSNSEGEYYESGESLKRLQMALHRSGMITEEKLQCPVCEFTCSVRSQFNDHLLSHETKCSMCDFNGETSEKLREHMRTVHDCDYDSSYGEEELNTPKVNSQGKVKTFRCKQCEFSAVTKIEFWEHSRTHIKQERLLTCPRCPFVTEYKHHLEYHLRNHFGSKPFKCNKCSYTCVNKSMLNSHLKSHSNIYQFRCKNCAYATKYCHSLKLHLRKYNHNPAMVLNPDGSPNPLPIVDVYGTRRGPKQKPKQDQLPVPPQPLQPQVNNIFSPYNLISAQMPYYNLLNPFPGFPFSQDINMEEKNNNVEKEVRDDKAPLDLSCPEPMASEDTNQEAQVRKRRKGKAFKLDRIARRLQEEVEVEEQQPVFQQPSSTPPPPPQPQSQPPVVAEPAKSPKIKSCEADSEQKTEKPGAEATYNCNYCDMSFKDIVMYTMHMGYHGYEDPFKCNMCGEHTKDKLSFFIHIHRIQHS